MIKKEKKARKTNRRRVRRRKQRAYTKLLNHLCRAAHHHKLKALCLEGDPKSKRTATILWIETIKDVLQTNNSTAELLDDYPDLPKKIPSIVNKALASFLRANVAHHAKNMLKGVNPKHGLGILRHLQEIYALASMKDRNQALAYLNELQMHPKDTITNFIQKYQRALKTLADVSRHTTPPDESEMMHLFVQKCLNSVRRL